MIRTWLRRWWRWFFNRNPIPGQIWDVDGIGLVEVTEISPDGWFMTVRRLARREGWRWRVLEFRSQAIMRSLQLEDLEPEAKFPKLVNEKKP